MPDCSKIIINFKFQVRKIFFNNNSISTWTIYKSRFQIITSCLQPKISCSFWDRITLSYNKLHKLWFIYHWTIRSRTVSNLQKISFKIFGNIKKYFFVFRMFFYISYHESYKHYGISRLLSPFSSQLWWAIAAWIKISMILIIIAQYYYNKSNKNKLVPKSSFWNHFFEPLESFLNQSKWIKWGDFI